MERAPTKPSVHFMSRSSEWETPQAVFDKLNAEFGLEIDVCATHENAKLPKFYTKEFNGLQASWKDAEQWLLVELSKRWEKDHAHEVLNKVLNLSDTELEDELYRLTRETNYFENFNITP